MEVDGQGNALRLTPKHPSLKWTPLTLQFMSKFLTANFRRRHPPKCTSSTDLGWLLRGVQLHGQVTTGKRTGAGCPNREESQIHR